MTKNPLFTLGRAAKEFYADRGMLKSAALAYYATLSFIPMLFLLLSIASLTLGDSQWLKDFINNNLAILPWAKKDLLSQVNKLQSQATSLGLLSVFFIVWTSGMFFSALQASLNSILAPKIRKFNLLRLGLPWLTSPILGALIIAAMLAVHVWGYIPLRFMPANISPGVWTWLVYSGLILFLYQMFSRNRPRFWPSLAVSFVIALFSQLVTKFIAYVLWSNPEYSLVYGPLSSVVLFLLWLNYSLALILLGAYFLKALAKD
jgi:membrane protein